MEKTDKEKKETADSFLKELKTLIKKYNIKNASFTGELEKNYFGVVDICCENFGDFFESSLNVAKLYQSCKEKVKKIFSDYEN